MGFQSKVIKDYESKGWTVLKVVKLSKDGFPDLLLYKGGVTMWIECKEGKDTLKPIQKYRIDQLNKEGIKTFCLHNTKGKIYPK